MAALCARRLGLDRETALVLMTAARERLGGRSFWLRAALFAVAVRPWPARLRRRAVVAFARPLLDTPAARNAYGAGRVELLGSAGAGLLRRP
jgi:hypothetical protein